MTRFNRWSLGVAVACLFATANGFGHGNEKGKAQAKVGNATVTIAYASPALKGRDVLKLIQPGHLWRLGADVPTTIESDADLDFGGVRVPKGKHILIARLIEPGKWALMVSSKPASQYEASDRIAEVPLELSEAGDSVEEMAIRLSSQGGHGVIEVAWGTHRLSAAFTEAR